MALFTKNELIKVSIKKSLYETADSILKKASLEFSEDKIYDIFISHSYLDADEILQLKTIIENMGFTTYVDWIEDGQLDRVKVDKETAEILRKRMDCCKSLFFVTSENSSSSKWMPWELGYFDALKGRVAILPILQSSESTDEYRGQEYLGLYPYVTKDRIQDSDKITLWVNENTDIHVSFEDWLEGKKPCKHYKH
ncbi:MAG: toll/interleukin-1 receptor domain-containing protein [Elusimicrobiales bacterium]|nr:toll/interleukin-1 receptor domain-containing protein [Elusimicrobiales bacterium]